MASQDPIKPRPAAVRTDITGESHTEPTRLDDASSVRTYVVREGDTWSSIAEKMYGDREGWLRIRDANRDLIEADDHLVPGALIRIPV